MDQRLRTSGVDSTGNSRYPSELRENDRLIRQGSRYNEDRGCHFSSPRPSSASIPQRRFDVDSGVVLDDDDTQRLRPPSCGLVHDTPPSSHLSASRSLPCRGRRDDDVHRFSTNVGMSRNDPGDDEMIASLVLRRRRSIGQDSSLVPLVHISPYLNHWRIRVRVSSKGVVQRWNKNGSKLNYSIIVVIAIF